MAGSEAAIASDGLRVLPALATSWSWLRARPVSSLAQGAAVALSLLSVCCGLGLVTTPWFLSELSASQLGVATGRTIARDKAAATASWLYFWAVLTITAVGAITLLGAELSLDALLQSGVIVPLLGAAAVWFLLMPLLYAPLLALEQRAGAPRALVESARLMVQAGSVASARLGVSAYVLQFAPLALAALLVSLDPQRAALWLLVAAPLTCVSVPLGQGVLVAAYVQVAQRAAPLERRVGQPLTAAVTRWVRTWTLLMALPIVSLVLLEASLSRPARLSPGTAPDGVELLVVEPTERPQTSALPAPATALTLRVSTAEVSVVASDGGGVGSLPLSAADPIERVRVVRVRDTFAIELVQAGRSYQTLIDRAGVRLDDGLRARLRQRSQPWEWLFFLLTLLLTGLLSVPVLADFGRLADSPEAQAKAREVAALRRARSWALWLAPCGLGCLGMALSALFAA
jgi:hypothetical protein